MALEAAPPEAMAQPALPAEPRERDVVGTMYLALMALIAAALSAAAVLLLF